MDLFWTGTDVFFMNQYGDIRFRFKVKIFIFRVLARVLDKWFTGRNWVISDHLGPELSLTKPTMTYEPPLNLIKYPKVEHDTFNILYYFPKKKNRKFIEWLYGYDIYITLKEYFGDRVNWILVDGSEDMSIIYPITDFYLRPNRHDGRPYMILECVANDIPYYWSRENPSITDAQQHIFRTVKTIKT